MMYVIVTKNQEDAYEYARAKGLTPIYIWWKPDMKQARKMADKWSDRAKVEIIDITK